MVGRGGGGALQSIVKTNSQALFQKFLFSGWHLKKKLTSTPGDPHPEGDLGKASAVELER